MVCQQSKYIQACSVEVPGTYRASLLPVQTDAAPGTMLVSVLVLSLREAAPGGITLPFQGASLLRDRAAQPTKPGL